MPVDLSHYSHHPHLTPHTTHTIHTVSTDIRGPLPDQGRPQHTGGHSNGGQLSILTPTHQADSDVPHSGV